MADWQSIKLKFFAVMTIPATDPGKEDQTFEFDVSQYSHEYELNAIPTCTLMLPLGRRADMVGDAASVATIHNAVNSLKIQVPVVVYCIADTLDASFRPNAQEWPADEEGNPTRFVVFRGVAVHGGFRRAFGDARYILSLAHWLIHLSNSSSLSQQTHPTTPSQFFYPATFRLDDPVGGGFLPGGLAAWVGQGVALPYFKVDALLHDIWGGTDPGEPGNGGMKSWFNALSLQDRLNVIQINAGIREQGELNCVLPLASKNSDALAALAKLEPYDFGYRMGVPLPLDPNGANTSLLADNIGKEIGMETLESYSNVTLWDKLAGQFHANYLFSVVPTVESALVVPFIPGLRGPVHRYISGEEYDSCEISGDLIRNLRGIAVMMGRTWSAGGYLGQEQQPAYPGIGGWFGTCRPGMVMFKEAPRWLVSVAPSFYSGASAPVDGVIGVANAPNVGRPVPPAVQPRGLFNDALPMWNAYAQARYVHEVLQHRMGSLTGKVRFDIAPGSLIRIQAAEDKFVWNLLGQHDFMHFFATVVRVSTVVDAEAGRAFTSFTLAHVRTEAENEDAATSICRHPLWFSLWSGCSLVDDPAFAPVSTKITDPDTLLALCGAPPAP